MALSVLPLDLARWDEAARDCLVLPVFRDDRPLRGAAGLADWRLCGRLSRLLKSEKATADAGETMLLPPGRRLRFKRVLWFGLGDAKGYSDDRCRKDLTWILGVVKNAGVTDWALQAPGRASGLIGARRAVEIILEDEQLSAQPITLLEDPAGQKDIAELLRSQRQAG
ncbi:MAG TPA: M17 family peptidase N-terminal domain-containing protein [Kofleriaceae bacterium]|nr:M17 family peptidase N-terminal domain-containing protein [Kofleriaceae bacterium]